jgi:hypothetical protein
MFTVTTCSRSRLCRRSRNLIKSKAEAETNSFGSTTRPLHNSLYCFQYLVTVTGMLHLKNGQLGTVAEPSLMELCTGNSLHSSLKSRHFVTFLMTSRTCRQCCGPGSGSKQNCFQLTIGVQYIYIISIGTYILK